jgi:REP element-mobilizing transposase RayT
MLTSEKSYYKRRLPHYQPENATFFITCRLSNSLPAEVLHRLYEEKKLLKSEIILQKDADKHKKLLLDYQHIYFGKFDEYLNKVTKGPRWLLEDRIAQIVSDALHYRDGKVFDLICYCIMPNHLHIVFNAGLDVIKLITKDSLPCTRDVIPLYKIMHSFNRALRRTGSFWQAESYDHVVRDENELGNIIRYTIYNPVKSGLCNDWNEWKWNYVKKGFIES